MGGFRPDLDRHHGHASGRTYYKRDLVGRQGNLLPYVQRGYRFRRGRHDDGIRRRVDGRHLQRQLDDGFRGRQEGSS
ncbi:MAG: hypothetical protein WDN06_09985 [Asticcacaulis sp.]